MTAIDMRQMSWGDSSKSGPWIKFALPDSETLEPLKTNDGKFFKVFLVPVDDNGDPLQGEKAAEQKPELIAENKINNCSSIDDATPKEWDLASKEKFKINDRPASNWAALQIKNLAFQRFFSAKNEEHCNQLLKLSLNIKSKSLIDTDKEVYQEFKRILMSYSYWCEGMRDLPDERRATSFGFTLDEDDQLALAHV